MMTWEVCYEDGTSEYVTTHSIVDYLKTRYPDYHIEVEQYHVLVWSSADVVNNPNVNPIAKASPA